MCAVVREEGWEPSSATAAAAAVSDEDEDDVEDEGDATTEDVEAGRCLQFCYCNCLQPGSNMAIQPSPSISACCLPSLQHTLKPAAFKICSLTIGY